MKIAGREIGPEREPFIIAEVGINHAGDAGLAREMIGRAIAAGAHAVKFQTHEADEFCDEPAYPGNAGGESIQNLIKRCSLTVDEERNLKTYCDDNGIIFLSTPFSKDSVDRLEAINVPAYKIGSGHLTDLDHIRYVVNKQKPIVLSTGMGRLPDISRAVNIMQDAGVPYSLLHCTSEYPTPYKHVRLGAMKDLRSFPLRSPYTHTDAPIGLSDHSVGIWTALGAVALGASIIEKHFCIDACPPGPDIQVSINAWQLSDLVTGSRAIWQARGGTKDILPGEQETREWFLASRKRA